MYNKKKKKKKKNIYDPVQEQRLTEILQAVRCHILWLY